MEWSGCIPVVVIGYMANNLLPMRLGELVRSYYVGEREGISKASALATVFVERVFDALTLLFFIAVIAPFVSVPGLAQSFAEKTGVHWSVLVLGLSLPFVGMFGALMLFAFYPERTHSRGGLFGAAPSGKVERIAGLFDLHASSRPRAASQSGHAWRALCAVDTYLAG